MSDWEEVEPAKCGVDGLKRKDCTLCDYFVEEVIPMPTPHSWSEWSNSTGFSCTNGGTRERTCQNTGCGVTEKQTVEPGDHIELVTTGKKAPTVLEAGSTGTTTCNACGETVSEATEIPKLVNEAANATVESNGKWPITGPDWDAPDTRPYLNDGDMNTGITANSSERSTTHTLTWANAVTVDTIKLYFNGDGTGKTVGYQKGFLENTNADTTITVNVYNGESVVKTVIINTKDLTEYTIDLGAATEITKITLEVYTGWSGAKAANIWECQAYIAYKAQ